MKAKYHEALFLVFVGIFVLLPSASRADWSRNVTLNGEHVNPLWFDIARHAIKQESDYCTVENEDWVREYVIMYLLSQQKFQPASFTADISQPERPIADRPITELTDNQILKLAENPATIQLTSLLMRNKRKTHLRKLTEELEPISINAIRKYYDNLKSEGHPVIVDAVYVKRRQLIIPKGDISDAVERRLAKGDDFMDLYAEFDPGFNHAIEGQHWYLVKNAGAVPVPDKKSGKVQESFLDWNRNVRNGEILGPINYRNNSIFYIQIVDKVHLDLVLLDKGLPGQPNYAKDWIRKQLERRRLPQSKKILREQATVLVYGKLVYADESSYNCGRYLKRYSSH